MKCIDCKFCAYFNDYPEGYYICSVTEDGDELAGETWDSGDIDEEKDCPYFKL